MTYERIRYETPVEGVARITLARPEAANAQDYLMLSELNAAFDEAASDANIRVVVLAAEVNTFLPGMTSPQEKST